MSTISETPNRRGYFEAKVWMGIKPDGRPDRRHLERKSLAALRRAVRELERKRDAGAAGNPGRTPTVRAMMTRHLDVVLPQRGRAPRTIADYWSKCRNDVFPRWGGQRIDRLLPEHIEDGYAEMLAAAHAAGHVRKVHAIISAGRATCTGTTGDGWAYPSAGPRRARGRTGDPELGPLVGRAGVRPPPRRSPWPALAFRRP